MAAQKIVIALTVILMLAGCITAQNTTPQTQAMCPAGTHFVKVNGVSCGTGTITSGNSTCSTQNNCRRNDKNCADYDGAPNYTCKECEWGYE
jgi:uncharacterized lipoprotein YajG